MAETKVVFEAKEWEEFLKKVGNYNAKGTIKRKPIELLRLAFATRGFKDIVKHFKKESGPRGKWRKRAASTDEMYEAIRSGKRKPPIGMRSGSFSKGNKLLQLTGKLRGSLLPTNIKKRGRNSIVFFSNDPKSGALDGGSKKKRLPARPFMWLSKKAQEGMAKLMLNLWVGR